MKPIPPEPSLSRCPRAITFCHVVTASRRCLWTCRDYSDATILMARWSDQAPANELALCYFQTYAATDEPCRKYLHGGG